MKENKTSFVDSITAKAPFSLGKNKAVTSADPKKPVKNTAHKNNTKATVYRKENKKFKFLEFKKPRILSWHGSLVILMLLPILLFGLTSYAYQEHNKGKIYTGVYTFGVDVGGKTKEEEIGRAHV